MSVEGQSSNAIRGGTLFSILISSKVIGLESKIISLLWQSLSTEQETGVKLLSMFKVAVITSACIGGDIS